jgi:hypothetical protein
MRMSYAGSPDRGRHSVRWLAAAVRWDGVSRQRSLQHRTEQAAGAEAAGGDAARFKPEWDGW